MKKSGLNFLAFVVILAVILAGLDIISSSMREKENQKKRLEAVLGLSIELAKDSLPVTLAGNYRFLTQTGGDSIIIDKVPYALQRYDFFGNDIVLRNSQTFVELSIYKDSLQLKKHFFGE